MTRLTLAQAAIIAALRNAPVPTHGPFPPGTAGNRYSFRVQVSMLRTLGYRIDCLGFVRRGHLSSPGVYHLISEPTS